MTMWAPTTCTTPSASERATPRGFTSFTWNKPKVKLRSKEHGYCREEEGYFEENLREVHV